MLCKVLKTLPHAFNGPTEIAEPDDILDVPDQFAQGLIDEDYVEPADPDAVITTAEPEEDKSPPEPEPDPEPSGDAELDELRAAYLAKTGNKAPANWRASTIKRKLSE